MGRDVLFQGAKIERLSLRRTPIGTEKASF